MVEPRTKITEPAKISGPLMAAAVSWIKSEYGGDVFEKAITKLSDLEKSQLNKMVLSIGWYDVPLFEKFCDLCYKEVFIKTGESRDVFDRRGIEEGGGAILKTIYKFILSMTQPVNTISRIPMLFKRSYSKGDIVVLSNDPGRCVLQFDVPEEMLAGVRRNNQFGYAHLLKLAGAKNVKVDSSEKRIETGYQIIVDISYQ